MDWKQSTRMHLIDDAPESADVDLPTDGSRRIMGLRLLLASAALVFIVLWGVW